MPDPNADLEAELDRLMPETATPPSEEADAGDNADESQDARRTPDSGEEADASRSQVEEFEIEGIKGRKFSLDSLKQAHSHAYRHISKLEGELGRMRKDFAPLMELRELCGKNPKLLEHLLDAADKFEDLVDQGVSTRKAAQATGLSQVPPELRKELEELKSWKSQQERVQLDRELTAELNDLTSKHKLDAVTRDNVIRLMIEEELAGRTISAEKALRYVRLDSAGQRQSAAERELERVRASADVGPSAASSGARRKMPQPGSLSPEQQNEWLHRWADSMGIPPD